MLGMLLAPLPMMALLIKSGQKLSSVSWRHNAENDIRIGHPNVSKYMIVFFFSSQHETFEKTLTDMLTKHGEKYPIVF